MKLCSECAYLVPNDHFGKFPCEHKRSGYNEVSARMQACDYFCPIFSFKRGKFEETRLERISKDHGYYIMTLLTNILKLDNIYLDAFIYVRDYYMMNNQKYIPFLVEYEENGPYLAYLLSSNVVNNQLLNNIKTNYLDLFVSQVLEQKLDDASITYINMFENLKQLFNCKKALIK